MAAYPPNFGKNQQYPPPTGFNNQQPTHGNPSQPGPHPSSGQPTPYGQPSAQPTAYGQPQAGYPPPIYPGSNALPQPQGQYPPPCQSPYYQQPVPSNQPPHGGQAPYGQVPQPAHLSGQGLPNYRTPPYNQVDVVGNLAPYGNNVPPYGQSQPQGVAYSANDSRQQFQYQIDVSHKNYNKFDLSTTNMALFGTDLETKIKHAASQGEQAWRGCGDSIGLKIWRIENFKVVPWPVNHYGSFYSGDSYIILNSYKRSGSPKLLHDIHFWIGEHSTQDEYGTAAYKTVELDDYLGGGPVQHREIQNHESKLFISYFQRINFLFGGVDSGFNKVAQQKQDKQKQEQQKRRLLHVSGKKNIIVREVSISIQSLNSGDSFILDFGLHIYLMNGKQANIMEKNKAGQTCESIKEDRKANKIDAEIHTFAEGENSEPARQFWAAFGTEPTPAIASATPDVDNHVGAIKMFQVSDRSGQLYSTPLHVPSQKREAFGLLRSDDAFIVDTGFDVFIWIGKGASKLERRCSMQMATQYLFSNQKPLHTPLTSVFEGGESEEFKAIFV